MSTGDRLRESMEQIRRSVEATGEQVRRATKQAAKEAVRASATTRRGGRRNVAVVANVGGDGRVRGVSVTQRSRIRPDGSEEIETTREVYGDDDGKE
jgi:predicted phage tail protein